MRIFLSFTADDRSGTSSPSVTAACAALEGASHGAAGDYLAVNPTGDAWPISAAHVTAHYSLATPAGQSR